MAELEAKMQKMGIDEVTESQFQKDLEKGTAKVGGQER